MRHIVLCAGLILFLPIILLAQKNKKEWGSPFHKRYYKYIMKEEDDDFKITEAPEEWKKESFVVLCQKMMATSSIATVGSYNNAYFIRKRVLLQDLSAVKDFSTFYYQDGESFGVSVTKPDGQVNEITSESVVSVETEVPRMYRNSFRSDAYFKLAIPNLEIGDIIDFYQINTYSSSSKLRSIIQLSYDYPVLYQKIIFDCDRKMKVAYRAFNGAPSFEYREKEGFHLYNATAKLDRLVLEIHDPKITLEEPWIFPLLNEPIVKVFASTNYFFGKGKKEDEYRIDYTRALQNSAGVEVLHDKRVIPIQKSTKKIINKLKIEKKKQITEGEKVDLLYRALRHAFISMKGNRNYYRSMNDYYFLPIFAHNLKKDGIEFKYVVTVPREKGSFEQAVFGSELEYGIYIPSTEKYYWTVDNYSIGGETRVSLAGIQAKVVLKEPGGWARAKYEDAYITETQSVDNVALTKMDIDLKEDKSLHFGAKVHYSGAHKDIYSRRLVAQTNFFEQDSIALHATDLEIKKEYIKLNEKGKQIIKEWVEDDFEVEDFKNVEILSSGITSKSPKFILKYEFTNNDLLAKAGNNLILELGKLISSQVELTEEEIENRTRDVNYDFAREFVHEISITLPDGYMAKGLEQFDMKVDNEYAAFISSVVQEGNVLKLKARKAYKNQTVPVENWSELVEMLEAAYNFTQKKVILSKG